MSIFIVKQKGVDDYITCKYGDKRPTPNEKKNKNRCQREPERHSGLAAAVFKEHEGYKEICGCNRQDYARKICLFQEICYVERESENRKKNRKRDNGFGNGVKKDIIQNAEKNIKNERRTCKLSCNIG